MPTPFPYPTTGLRARPSPAEYSSAANTVLSVRDDAFTFRSTEVIPDISHIVAGLIAVELAAQRTRGYPGAGIRRVYAQSAAAAAAAYTDRTRSGRSLSIFA